MLARVAADLAGLPLVAGGASGGQQGRSSSPESGRCGGDVQVTQTPAGWPSSSTCWTTLQKLCCCAGSRVAAVQPAQ